MPRHVSKMTIRYPSSPRAGKAAYRMAEGLIGFAFFTLFLVAAALALPPVALQPGSGPFILGLGLLALWRYGWAATHFVRSLIYRKIVFPRWRSQVERGGGALMPSQVYLLITSYRIDAAISIEVFRAATEEAIRCGTAATIVASIVELGDEFMLRDVFESCDPPPHVKLMIVRVAGVGKRDALARAFVAISRDMPQEDALVALMDGDSVMQPGMIRRTAPFFALRPYLGALTTDETCVVLGSRIMKDWHEMRFAQRHIMMSSLALSGRVMTLTGRYSLFRAGIITHPDFIDTILNDHLDHWRLGRFRFLTGDDKSSLYWVLKNGYEQIYVPDTAVLTVEDPPTRNFFAASTMLMVRWFGNMLRTNTRVLRLGILRMPFFVWWSFLDQRLSMWTTLAGPVFVTFLAIEYDFMLILYYFVWVAFVRWVQALVLLSARGKVSWTWPFLLYYSQVYGAVIKIYMLFHPDRQAWTRQKIRFSSSLSVRGKYWRGFSSAAVNMIAVICFIGAIGWASGVFGFSFTAWRSVLTLPL